MFLIPAYSLEIQISVSFVAALEQGFAGVVTVSGPSRSSSVG